jgi:hypothetical protein
MKIQSTERFLFFYFSCQDVFHLSTCAYLCSVGECIQVRFILQYKGMTVPEEAAQRRHTRGLATTPRVGALLVQVVCLEPLFAVLNLQLVVVDQKYCGVKVSFVLVPSRGQWTPITYTSQ